MVSTAAAHSWPSAGRKALSLCFFFVRLLLAPFHLPSALAFAKRQQQQQL